MTVYADPTRCPDCRTPLGVAPRQCPRCSLPLTGPVVDQLFATLTHADGLLTTLRASKVAAPAARATAPVHGAAGQQPAPATGQPVAPYAPHGATAQGTPPHGGPAAPPAPARTPLLGLGTVPRILLGLGALFLLVGALTFLAMTWALLGTGGRTAVLVAFTACAGVTAWAVGRAGLRIACEALTLVAFGFGVLDLTGARAAGWFGDLSSAGGFVLVGVVLSLSAFGLTASAQLRGARPLVVPQALVPVGAVSFGLGLGDLLADHPPFGMLLAVALGAAFALAAHRLGLVVLGNVMAGLVTLWWSSLLIDGAGLLGTSGAWSYAELVREPGTWSLLAAAAVAALLPFLTSVTRHVLPAALGTSLAIVVTLLAAPSFDEAPALQVLIACAVLAAGAAAVALAPSHRWAVLPGVPTAVAALVVGLTGAWLGILGILGVARAGLLDAGATQRLVAPDTDIPGLMAVPVVLSLALAATAYESRVQPLRHLGLRSLAAVALAATAALLLVQAPLVAPVAVLLVSAALAHVVWWRTGSVPALVTTVCAATLGGIVALPSDELLAVAFAVASIAAATAWLRGGSRATVAPTVTVLTAALAVWTATHAAGLGLEWAGLATLVLLAPLALVRPQPQVEAPVVVVTAVSALLSVPFHSSELQWASILLVVGAVFLFADALVHPHRRSAAVAGGLLLVVGLWCQLAHQDVSTVEAYSLPLAAALLVPGVVLMARRPYVSSLQALGGGLAVALLPSLAVVLASDGSELLRVGLLMAASVALVVVGAVRHLNAPLVLGALVGTVLALHLAAPIAYLVPPFIWLAASGVVLTACGITWEARMANVRATTSYLSRLR